MEVASKQCTKCGEAKALTEYDKGKGRLGVIAVCKACKRVWSEKYYQNNKKKINNTTKVCAARRYASNPAFALRCTLSSRLYSALVQATKSAPTLKLLGMDFNDFTKWMEFQFLDDRMSWQSRGSYWQVDHVTPFAKVDITKVENQELVCNAMNLRPLSKKENNAKKAKYDSWLNVCQEVKFRYFNKHLLNDKYRVVVCPIEVKR